VVDGGSPGWMEKHSLMSIGNHPKSPSVFRLLGLLALVATGCGLSSAMAAPGNQNGSSVLSKCKADLAKRLKLQAEDVTLASAQNVAFPDSALGMPEAGKTYARVKTPGQKLILSAHNWQYLYMASGKAIRYGGPMSIWSCSMLYMQRVPNEPNLNHDLYQCSLLGTNSIRLVSAVNSYYPQDNGSVIATRRTSRSSHDLLCVEASQPGKEKMLYHATEFGEAVFNKDHTRWAGFARPGLGMDWNVVIGRVGEDPAKAHVLPIPKGLLPDQIAWSDNTVMILIDKDDGGGAFKTSPDTASPVWKKANAFDFPGHNRFMLSKSESLEIGEVKGGDKPAVEVARIRFSGERRVMAKITGLAMQGCDLLSPCAIIWGYEGPRTAAYTVDIRSGATVAAFLETGSDIKPFACPPHNSPVSAQ